MKFGLSVGVSPREPLQRVADIARAAESYGFDTMWVLDCQFTMKDVYVAMTLGALATRTIKFGTGVTTPFNRHPTVTATAISAVSEVSGGRAILGIGAGGNAIFPLGLKPATVAHTSRVVAGLRRLLDGGEAQFSDDEPLLRIATGRADVPVYMAATKPRMLEAAGQVADGVILMGPAQPEWVREQVGRITAGAEKAGRRRQDLVIDLMIGLSVDEDRRQAIDGARPWVAAQARVFSSLKELPQWARPYEPELQTAARTYDYAHHLSRHATHRDVVSDGLTTTVAVAGPVEDCIERIQALAAEDIDRITVTLLAGGRENRLRVIGEQIVAAVVAAESRAS